MEPVKPKAYPQWATWIPGRSPIVKLHNTRSQAVQAVKCKAWGWPRQLSRAVIWHWDASERDWVNVCDMEWKTPLADLDLTEVMKYPN